MLDTTTVTAWLADFCASITEHAHELTELDRQIGDADHGSNMTRGCAAVTLLKASDHPDAAAMLKQAGMTLVSTVGGAAGPLYGTFFLRLAATIGEDGELTTERVATALRAGLDGIVARGKAAVGDKTLVDTLTPAVFAFDHARAEGADLPAAWEAALEAAHEGRDATVEMVARKGRASYLGDRSRGTADPGATSMALLLDSAARHLV